VLIRFPHKDGVIILQKMETTWERKGFQLQHNRKSAMSFLKQQFLLGEAAMMYLEPEHASVWPSQCRCYQVLAPPVIVAGARMEYLIHTSVTSVFSLHIKFA
jgi:hypothetical protein